MINENFVYVGFIIGFLGGLSYLVDTLRGRVKPNRVSWFLWAVAPLIAFFAELKQGVGIQALMTFSVGFNPLLIFIASFVNKKSQWKLTRFDISCGILSVFGILLWYLSKNADVAIFFSILADGLAALPTIVKSYKEPETENYWAFLAGAVNSGITLLVIREWNFAHFGFPVYIFAVCILLTILIKYKLGAKLQHHT